MMLARLFSFKTLEFRLKNSKKKKNVILNFIAQGYLFLTLFASKNIWGTLLKFPEYEIFHDIFQTFYQVWPWVRVWTLPYISEIPPPSCNTDQSSKPHFLYWRVGPLGFAQLRFQRIHCFFMFPLLERGEKLGSWAAKIAESLHK